MDEFRPQLDGNRRLRFFRDYLPSQYASADAIAGFEYRYAPARIGEQATRGEASGACPHNENIIAGGVHVSSEPSVWAKSTSRVRGVTTSAAPTIALTAPSRYTAA